MRRLPLLVLAACSNTTTSSSRDAAIDGREWFDARSDSSYGPPDAWATRPCDAPLTFAEGLVPTRVLHVEAGAVGGDGSTAAPFGSIAAAAAVATPGTFIQLGPGNHATNQFIPNLRGTASAPIWIGAVHGTHPRINGGAEALHLTSPQYVVIQNLDLHDQHANGINIDDGVGHAGEAHHVAIVGVNVFDVLSTGGGSEAAIKMSGVDDIAVYDSALVRCGRGVDLIGVHRGVIARNAISGNLLDGVQTRGGTTDVDIRQNRLRDNGNNGVVLGGSTPFAQFRPPLSTTTPNSEARRVRAFDNVVNGATYGAFSFVSCVDCLVAHNLSFGNQVRMIGLFDGNTTQNGYVFEHTRNGRVINNSFVWTGSVNYHVEVGSGPEPATFTFSHNLWWSQLTPSDSQPRMGPSPFGAVPDIGAVIGIGTGYSADPTIYCGGPEANAAASLPEVDGTIEGFCRATADAPTIGPLAVTFSGCDI